MENPNAFAFYQLTNLINKRSLSIDKQTFCVYVWDFKL